MGWSPEGRSSDEVASEGSEARARRRDLGGPLPAVGDSSSPSVDADGGEGFFLGGDDRVRRGARAADFEVRAPTGLAAGFAPELFSRVGHSGLTQSVHGGRPASIAVTTGAWQTGHGGWSFSSFPRWGSGYVTRHDGYPEQPTNRFPANE